MYNLVVITPDQMRADALGCYGNSRAGTRHIDALASSGVTLENCYCAAPLCGPSRISFATSTYLSEHNHRNYWSTISPDVPNIASVLKKSGYRTGMFGKNHLYTYSRLGEVWDELDEICLGNYDGHPDYKHSFSSFTLDHDHPYNITGRLTDEAVGFMKKESEKPFFLWLNYQDPHPAFTCPPPYDTMFDPAEMELDETWRGYDSASQPIRNEVWRAHSEMDSCTDDDMKRAKAHYMGQVRYVDDCVGRVTEHLRQSGLAENTVVLFFSDHGELLGDYGMTHKLPTFYDCLAKIPMILRHPKGRYAGARFKGLVEEVDLVPTLLELLGVRIPFTMVGQSLCAALEAGEYEYFRASILCEAGGGAPTCKAPIDGLRLVAPHLPTSLGPGAMLRVGDYKLSIYSDDRCELYNLADDPRELRNLYEDKACEEIRTKMTLELLKRVLSVKTRDIGALEWDGVDYPQDVRFEPLEMSAEAITDIRAQE